MEFALGDDGGANKTAEVAAAALYPQIRLFTVGECFYSPQPLPALRSISQPWVQASPHSVARGGMFGEFSAVCWFFGRQVADANPRVPIGLIASTRGGSPIAEWGTGGQKACGKPTVQGALLQHADRTVRNRAHGTRWIQLVTFCSNTPQRVICRFVRKDLDAVLTRQAGR